MKLWITYDPTRVAPRFFAGQWDRQRLFLRAGALVFSIKWR